ncbi:hypothetical protein [Candidatus Nanohalovita haloferacivicina]|uniref:hypothetical protein n=1 Tax=Candidatus Nanohalovita haloferacivicina TaxID=2978046 RepID=UPI00325F9ADE|nr:hypothetical protein HBNXNv_1178 [Candidatus Nanohalobia archaeon BNXNv]
MRSELRDGLIYGLFLAGLTFLTVKVLGFNPASLTVLLYLNVLMGLVINLRSENLGLESVFGQLMVAVEGEEQKVKRVFTGEEYVLNGTMEKIEEN